MLSEKYMTLMKREEKGREETLYGRAGNGRGDERLRL